MKFSLYFHIPFCLNRCAYCDFNTYAGMSSLIPSYQEALLGEITAVSRNIPLLYKKEGGGWVDTIYFGGGTPSLLQPKEFLEIIKWIYKNFNVHTDAEISLEANPGTVTGRYLSDLRSVGFNRISFGVQSFHPDELRQLERIHDPFDVIKAMGWARSAGFTNINMDLIYGLPEQRLERWQATMRQALAFSPEHLSIYPLVIEKNTPYWRWSRRGLMPVPDEDVTADMYEWSMSFLGEHGYIQYEISNWSIDAYQCRHNLQIWRNHPYLGFGAGAHGYASGYRVANIKSIRSYISRINQETNISPFPSSPATIIRRKVDLFEEMQDTVMLGLRLTSEGVSIRNFRQRFNRDLDNDFREEINLLSRRGLIERVDVGDDEILRLTKRGCLMGNEVFLHFVG